jgi:hypothetical protein
MGNGSLRMMHCIQEATWTVITTWLVRSRGHDR